VDISVEHVEEATPLPLWAVRLNPRVDQTNRPAISGRWLVVLMDVTEW
jgi:hypothetical protein